MTPRDWPGLRRVFRLPSTAARLRADVDAELEFHIQGRIEELISLGMTREEATHEARRRFGDRRRIEDEVERLDRGSQRTRTWRDRAESLWSDVHYTIRTLARQPMFVIVVVTTLTLGIGATAAIFHAVDRIVLHPLPYAHPERIVYLGWKWKNAGGSSALSFRKFEFWHDHSHVFDGLATSRTFDALAGEDGSNTTVQGERISLDFLRVIGMQPAIGRAFAPSEFELSAAPVAILTHAYWIAHFGGDRTALGRTVRLDGRLYTVVGVMPESFELEGSSGDKTQVLVPFIVGPKQRADGGNNYLIIGRLRAGLSEPQIADDMASVFESYRTTYPDLVEADDHGVRLMTYQSLFVGDFSRELWILLGATVFVFLLACANVGNLAFARALSRRREFAVRTALGAARGRVVRQVVLEMAVLGLISLVLAIIMSLASVRGLVALAREGLLRDSQLRLDPRVVVSIAVVAIAASVVIGMLVALAATRVNLTNGLSGAARGAGIGARQRRFRGALVATESAIAMILLSGAGLLIASFAHVTHVDPGYRRDGVFTASVPRAPKGYETAAAVWQFEQRVLERLRATPGISIAGAASNLPLQRGWNLPVTVEGRNDAAEGDTEWRSVSPSYFETMGIPILAGRDIAASDTPNGPAVVIVSQSYANTYWPGENPIGRRILVGNYKGVVSSPDFAGPPRTIIGVVPDLRDFSLEQTRIRHTVWVPQSQAARALVNIATFAVRANDAGVAATALRRAIADADTRMGVADVASMDDVVSRSLSSRRFSTVLMSLFAALALVLTCVGIYGVVSYSVSQRVQEIGVRMALGARPAAVVGLIVRQGMRPAAIGLVVGLLVALALSRLLAKMLFGVTAHDPLSFGVVAAMLAAFGLAASYIPARRASRIDPVAALRAD